MLFTKKFSKELFANPTSEFRGAPFWAWNAKLDKQELLWQIDIFKKMGLGGFHMHSRSGLATEYLSDEFMEMVKACAEKAEKEDMLCWLYDEDRWPSGAAGGIVTKEKQYRARYLLFTPVSYDKFDVNILSGGKDTAKGSRNNQGTLLARYEVVLKDGLLNSFRRLEDHEKISQEGTEWFAYLEIASTSAWFNNQAYLNTLDRKAVERFIEVTHERYKEVVGDKFGGVIPAIFTDEPQFPHKTAFGFAEDTCDMYIPYSDAFEADFKQLYGSSFLDKLPEIFWDKPEQGHFQHRYRYHDFVAEKFAESFADTIGQWCRDNNIMLTGHMMEEPTLKSQSNAIGDCMRSYRSFQLPGIDMLCDWREYSTAKQAQSASHQFGCPGVLSELYGVTNWDFDFRRHKLQGDWQAALGVNVRVHHLSWVSMAGDAKRDYPASISYQSPWYEKYPLVEDHFARVHTAMTQGTPKVDIAVIHPVESYWLHMGPDEQSGIVKQELENNFTDTIDWLLHEHLDFDFICESLLPGQVQYGEGTLPSVGKMQYKAILVPSCHTIRRTTLEFLRRAAAAGCKIIFSGEIPQFIDAERDSAVEEFAETVEVIKHSRPAIKQSLEAERIISIKGQNGMESDRHIYQMRDDGEFAYLFIAPSGPASHQDTAYSEKIRIALTGIWIPQLLDTLTGEIKDITYSYFGNQTVISQEMFEHDSLLFKLEKGRDTNIVQEEIPAAELSKDRGCVDCSDSIELPSEVQIDLLEDNVLLLDMAEYSLNGEKWQELEELLRINTKLRKQLGWPDATTQACQPWAMPEYVGDRHTVALRFTIVSGIENQELALALETPEQTEIVWNGEKVFKKIDGWFTDKSIKRVSLSALKKGENTLELRFPFLPTSTLEWCYLLGNFGVSVQGRKAVITERSEKLSFGDWCGQGLPFYAGNVEYQIPVFLEAGKYLIETPQFRNPLLSFAVDGKETGEIAFAPYQSEFIIEKAGMHTLTLRAYGNRVNAFGAVHNCDPDYKWFGPSAWVTEGRSFSYEYQLKRMGVLVTPRLHRIGNK
jgi:hypothetical protein